MLSRAPMWRAARPIARALARQRAGAGAGGGVWGRWGRRGRHDASAAVVVELHGEVASADVGPAFAAAVVRSSGAHGPAESRPRLLSSWASRFEWSPVPPAGSTAAPQPPELHPDPFMDHKGPRLVACGRSHMVVVSAGGVFGVGLNSLGQLGLGTEVDSTDAWAELDVGVDPGRVVQVVCGLDHTLFLLDQGTVLACGWGADGQLGLGGVSMAARPSPVGGALDGVAVVSLSSAADSTLAVDADGAVYAWGNSEYGQLGLGVGEPQVLQPTRVDCLGGVKVVGAAAGGAQSLFLTSERQLLALGYNVALPDGDPAGAAPGLALQPHEISLGDLAMVGGDRPRSVCAGLGGMGLVSERGGAWVWGGPSRPKRLVAGGCSGLALGHALSLCTTCSRSSWRDP